MNRSAARFVGIGIISIVALVAIVGFYLSERPKTAAFLEADRRIGVVYNLVGEITFDLERSCAATDQALYAELLRRKADAEIAIMAVPFDREPPLGTMEPQRRLLNVERMLSDKRSVCIQQQHDLALAAGRGN